MKAPSTFLKVGSHYIVPQRILAIGPTPNNDLNQAMVMIEAGQGVSIVQIGASAASIVEAVAAHRVQHDAFMEEQHAKFEASQREAMANAVQRIVVTKDESDDEPWKKAARDE